MTRTSTARMTRAELLERLRRAVFLDVEPLSGSAWRVNGGTASHIVQRAAVAPALTCDCADAAMRRAICKHALAVRLRLGDPVALRGLRELVAQPKARTRRERLATGAFPFGGAAA